MKEAQLRLHCSFAPERRIGADKFCVAVLDLNLYLNQLRTLYERDLTNRADLKSSKGDDVARIDRLSVRGAV